MRKEFFLVLAALCLGACATPPPIEETAYFPPYAADYDADKPENGAIYYDRSNLTLFEDIKARRPGDILTVILVEQTSGQKSADNNLSESSAVDFGTPTFGGSSRPNLNVDLAANRNFDGESGSSQSNSLNGSVTVTVRDVLPGGNLLVQGEKWIQINQGKEYIRLEGIVRPRDVDTNNTVLSTQVADARISYSGTGPNAQSNSPGWGMRILFNTIFPF